MVAAVASRTRFADTNGDVHPPTKKTKLSQPASESRPNGFKALLNGKRNRQSPLTAKVNGANHIQKDRVDEAPAVVRGGVGEQAAVDMTDKSKVVIEISSNDEESDFSTSEDDDEEVQTAPTVQSKDTSKPVVNGTIGEADQQTEEGTAEPEELSFGERLQAHEPAPVPTTDVVDVEAAFEEANAESRTLVTVAKNRQHAAPSAASVGTVLTQALRSNDQQMLDSCLRTDDPDIIYATVERLPSPLVGNLLQKLAERLHKRPGRAGMLMIWVQWSLAAHGGYLASQPQLVKSLATLNKVLKERASGLQPLLSLKGRLDMLHAQLELRRRNQKRTVEDEENEAVIYVEGEDDSSSEGGDEDAGAHGVKKQRTHDPDADEDESSGDDMPTTMAYHEEDDSEEGSEDEEEGMFDDEASETDDDSGDEMSEPMSDDEVDGEEGSESEEESKRVRRSTVGRTRY